MFEFLSLIGYIVIWYLFILLLDWLANGRRYPFFPEEEDNNFPENIYK
jgi:purine-cytosine permease-like protein